MKMKCPHCHQDIDLVGPKELKDEYKLNSNPVAHQRALGVFPEPVLSFPNRNIYLRADIEDYVEGLQHEKVQRLVERVKETLDALPEIEREEALRILDGKRK